jgi:hypothetical protein
MSPANRELILDQRSAERSRPDEIDRQQPSLVRAPRSSASAGSSAALRRQSERPSVRMTDHTLVRRGLPVTLQTRELYRSSSGDRWRLARDSGSGHVFVIHEPNLPSGGRASRIEIGAFLAGGGGPEHQELLRLIGTLIEGVADA